MINTPPHLTPWMPGRQGKGFTTSDGRVFSWAVEGLDGHPVHDEAWYNITRPTFGLNVKDPMFSNPFYISPEGELALYNYIVTGDLRQAADHIISQDPRLHHQHKDAQDIFDRGTWNFTANAKIPPIPAFNRVNLLSEKSAEKAWELVNEGWTPGKSGKGMINANQLYTWNVTDDDGWPHHDHICNILETAGIAVDKDIYHQIIAYIDQDGEFDCEDEKLEPMVARMDPRLRPTSESFRMSSVKTADEGGGGGEGGGESSGGESTPTHSDTPHEHQHYIMGVPWYGGPWGRTHVTFQHHHRRRKTKRRKKKSDFWDDQRMQDFPEDFTSTELESTKPTVYSAGDIQGLLAKGHTQGRWGKGIMTRDGQWIAEWDADAHGGPHHDEVMSVLRIFDPTGYQYMGMDPHGTITNYTEAYEVGDDDNWHFGFWMGEEDSDQLNWEEGNDGKGILFKDGNLHTWNSEDYETHAEYVAEHPHLDEVGAQFLYIDKNGKVSSVWGGLSPDHEERIREADPRLYVDIDTGNGVPWQFG